MNISLSKTQLRITALWAFSEAFLGGMLHGFHVPFTGLVLAAFASICIAALTLHDYGKGKIIKATLLVLIVKAVLSPHTPITAYFAVFLQGLFGELIFSIRFSYFFSCLCTGLFALLQSAFQKLIILTILFGFGFWKAMDEFLNSVTKELGFLHVYYSFYLVMIYVLLHLIAGVMAGIFAGRLPRLIRSSKNEIRIVPYKLSEPEMEIYLNKKTKGKFKSPLFWILFFLLTAVIYNVYVGETADTFIKSKALSLLVRSALILLLWYFFIAPILLRWFRKWLSGQKNKFSGEVGNILLLIPEMKYITTQCWLHASDFKGLKRIRKFIRLTFLTLLSEEKHINI